MSDSQKDGEGRRWGNRQYSLILIYFIFTSCLMIKCIYIIIIHLGGGGSYASAIIYNIFIRSAMSTITGSWGIGSWKSNCRKLSLEQCSREDDDFTTSTCNSLNLLSRTSWRAEKKWEEIWCNITWQAMTVWPFRCQMSLGSLHFKC